MKRILLLGFLFCLAPAVALAQVDCPTIVDRALSAADQLCSSIGRNQACYGNIDISAQAQPDVQNFRFTTVGDIVNVGDVETMHLSPMNEETGAWGVAVLQLQANLPDTLPGQNVTFLLFGNVEITNAADPNDPAQHPMQAFYLRTGIGDADCQEAPESGLLVQTPEGADEIAFNVNGVDVSMGSTVLFQADEEQGMSVSTLEGAAFVAAEDGAQPIAPGSWVRIGLGRDLRATGAPELPQSYQRRTRMLESLPIRLLRRKITVAPPMTQEQIDLAQQRIQDGKLPCGVDGLPECRKFLHFLQTRIQACMALPARQRPRFCTSIRRFVDNAVSDGLIAPVQPGQGIVTTPDAVAPPADVPAPLETGLPEVVSTPLDGLIGGEVPPSPTLLPPSG